jgi:hypothetical protein
MFRIWRIEPVDDFLVGGFEAGFVLLGMFAGERDDLAVVFGCLGVVASCLANHAEAIIAVVDAGEAFEKNVGGALGFVEFSSVDEIDHGVGRLGEFIKIVVDGLEEVEEATGARRLRLGALSMGGVLGRFVIGEATFLVFLAAATGTRFIPSGFGHIDHFGQRRDALYQEVLADTRFHEQLLVFDLELAEQARAEGCTRCDGVLHWARYTRKPRGVPPGLCADYSQRCSFCCAVEGCRSRMTPASLRFLGCKVYVATMVTLISAMHHGLSEARLRRLLPELRVDRRTLARWRTWWLSDFASSRAWRAASARFPAPVEVSRLPAARVYSRPAHPRRALAHLAVGPGSPTISMVPGARGQAGKSRADARRREQREPGSTGVFYASAEPQVGGPAWCKGGGKEFTTCGRGCAFP